MTEKPILDPLIASVWTQMATDSAATTNSLLDMHEARIKELRQDYVQLWERLAEANVKVDSMRIDHILGSTEHKYLAASNAVEREES